MNTTLRNKFRPKRVVFTLYWDWSGHVQHFDNSPYDCHKMIAGYYRKLIARLKNIFMTDPLYREERMKGGKIKTTIGFIR